MRKYDFFETKHYCIFKISASGNGATFFSFLSPPPLQCPGQVLYYQPDQRYVYLYLYCDNWRPSIDDCRYMLVMQDSLNYCPVGVLRYPIWFKSMFEFCQKIIHSIFDSILLYPRFNSKYYSIKRIFCWFNSKDNWIQ